MKLVAPGYRHTGDNFGRPARGVAAGERRGARRNCGIRYPQESQVATKSFMNII